MVCRKNNLQHTALFLRSQDQSRCLGCQLPLDEDNGDLISAIWVKFVKSFHSELGKDRGWEPRPKCNWGCAQMGEAQAHSGGCGEEQARGQELCLRHIKEEMAIFGHGCWSQLKGGQAGDRSFSHAILYPSPGVVYANCLRLLNPHLLHLAITQSLPKGQIQTMWARLSGSTECRTIASWF